MVRSFGSRACRSGLGLVDSKLLPLNERLAFYGNQGTRRPFIAVELAPVDAAGMLHASYGAQTQVECGPGLPIGAGGCIMALDPSFHLGGHGP